MFSIFSFQISTSLLFPTHTPKIKVSSFFFVMKFLPPHLLYPKSKLKTYIFVEDLPSFLNLVKEVKEWQ
ncbi:MAG: hypothetical protein DRI28_07250 [Caldiserica bacterium]|nr:MAG: hypothetical protein DRI28_07250 [Caldisericota bacterium]